MFLPEPLRRRPAAASAPPRRTWPMEALLLAISAFWAVTANLPFLRAALGGRDLADPTAWGLGLALVVGLVALHALLLGLVVHRWVARPVLVLMVVVTAAAAHYIGHLSVYLDPTMLRNVVRTDVKEARELISPSLLLALLLYAGVPLLLLWRVQPARRSWPRAVAVRTGFLLACAAVLVGAVFAAFGPLASLMRQHKELRYLITPANVLYSVAHVAAAEARTPAGPRQPIGEDAAPGPRAAARTRPTLLVLVVGETARAANWGLSGYARPTTPELARLPVINFPDVTACGTNTEVSVPCMFAPVGRRDYDEAKIRSQQSVLHVLARAGVGVTWRDNQSGCKGVCEGLPTQHVNELVPPGQCKDGRCPDEGLLHGLPEMLPHVQGTQLLVLHMLGNHGPSYFRRYPAEFEHFVPACRRDDLRECPIDEVVNAYDNALRYTDHVVATLVRQLQAASGQVDTAMIYVSDHGESLGEANLFLHGLPWAIAPDVQKKVPMVMWFSDGFARSAGLDLGCLRQAATQPASHDHLMHTVMGLLDVRSSVYAPPWDLSRPCRSDGATR